MRYSRRIVPFGSIANCWSTRCNAASVVSESLVSELLVSAWTGNALVADGRWLRQRGREYGDPARDDGRNGQFHRSARSKISSWPGCSTKPTDRYSVSAPWLSAAVLTKARVTPRRRIQPSASSTNSRAKPRRRALGSTATRCTYPAWSARPLIENATIRPSRWMLRDRWNGRGRGDLVEGGSVIGPLVGERPAVDRCRFRQASRGRRRRIRTDVCRGRRVPGRGGRSFRGRRRAA